MKMRLNIDKITRGLGTERRGKVAVSGGYFGAQQLLAELKPASARDRAVVGRRMPVGPNDAWCRSRRER